MKFVFGTYFKNVEYGPPGAIFLAATKQLYEW